MCSIFKYKTCVGRNFDYEQSYDEELRFIDKNEFDNKYKILGMCTGFVKDYPLMYDGINQYGLVAGGLAFTGNAQYNELKGNKLNIPSYDFTFKILGHFHKVDEVIKWLGDVNITNEAYSDVMPPSDLHWFVSDQNRSIIIEQTVDGLSWYEGDVMTNNPPYPLQLQEYEDNEDCIGEPVTLKGKDPRYDTRGTETISLNGDYTSMGRFTRLSYIKSKLEQSDDTDILKNDELDVIQSFHLLSSIEQVYGLTPVEDKFEYTIYSIVYDMKNKKAHLKTYLNSYEENGIDIND